MYVNNDFVYSALGALESILDVPIDVESYRGQRADVIFRIEDNKFYGVAKKMGKRTNYALINEILEEKQDRNYVIIADYLTEKATEILKENKINYLDSSGNCYIKFQGLLFSVKGEKNRTPEKTNQTRAFQEAGLKLLLVLLSHPKSLQYSYRKLAKITAISLGSVSNIFDELEEDNFLVRATNGRLLKNKDELKRLWVSRYNEVLRPRLFRKRFKSFDRQRLSKEEIKNMDLNVFWSGEAGGQLLNDYLIPQNYIFYSNEELKQLTQALRLIPDEDGNIEVYEKFWTDYFEIENEKTAPKLVIYADLINTGNSRNLEMAKLILDE